MKLILASASPRRRELLAQAGYEFEVEPSSIDEPEPVGEVDVRSYVSELAFRKALAVARRRNAGLILAADTACAIDRHILNKPIDRNDAERMIRLQEGREIEVWTALVLFQAELLQWLGAAERSVVIVRPLTTAERTNYLDGELWRGKAGGYGVQDDDPFVTLVSGSASNVVGLPMERFESMLERAKKVLENDPLASR
jgi:septum formation protein